MARRVEHCKVCGRHESVCGPLSKRKRCATCAEQRARDAARQLHERSGPYYDRFRQNTPQVDRDAA